MHPLSAFLRTYYRYETLPGLLQDALLLAIRLTWGLQFVQTGWGKWHSLPKVTAFFAELGIPLPALNAHVVATTELVGGLLLALGLLSRLGAAPLIFAMIVAYATSEQEAIGQLMQGNPDPFFAAAPFLFLLASLVVLVFGSGRYSVDFALKKKFEKSAE